MNRDFWVYGLHIAFWSAFGITRVLRSDDRATAAGSAPEAAAPVTAPYSRAMLVFHMVAFGLMYFGLGNAVVPNRVPNLFAGQRWLGASLIIGGAGLACWALLYFRSWRFRALLEPGHQLATGGPFVWLRHPIYGALNLLAIGSALWVPTPSLWVAAALMIIGSDLRGRAEEGILTAAFGSEYTRYMQKTRRFIPGLY